MPPLVTCPHCRLVSKLVERACAHCGRNLRDHDGRVPLTAAAAILGLTMTACGGPKEPVPAPAYGVVEVPPPTNTVPAPEPTDTTAPPPPAPTAQPSADPNQVPPEPTAAPAYGVALPPVEKPE